MQPVTTSDFLEWKAHPVTKAFYAAIVDRITEAKDVLGNTAGLDSGSDNYLRGFIAAYRDSLDFRIDDLQDAGE